MLRRHMTVRSVVVVLVCLLVVVVFGNSLGTPVTDIKPEVYFAPGRMLGAYLSAWTSSPYLGNANFNVGLGPVVAVLAPGAALGLSPEMLYKVFHLALWLVAAFGANRALREFVPKSSRWAGLAAAILYVANPYAVVGGSTLAILLPYAFFPWLVVAFIRAMRDPGSWRWPAAFGLAFFAMSGMNVAVVPIFQLLVVPPLAVVVGRAARLSWLAIVRVTTKCALFVVGVSLYWLIPSLSATTTGLQVTAESESIEGIARVSSMVEVLRGMGMWSIYGSDADGPWLPAFAPYLSNPVVVLITLAWPVAALLALHAAPSVLRRSATVTIGIGAVVLVGFFPGTVSTPLAAAIQRIFDLVPALVAFRTTNKAGAVLALFFALLIGNALPRWFAGLSGRRHPRALACVSAAVALSTVAVWVMPALVGNLYSSPVDVPGYWRAAAKSVDAQSHSSRVLFLPGQVRPSYRWTDERVDDLSNSLMSREAVIPYSSPNASAPGANYLSALSDLVASGQAAPQTVSTMARYLGAGDVLLRHDMRWEDSGGVRPVSVASMAAADPGLLGLANFGEPGQNIGPGAETGMESILPPVQHYGVQEAQRTISARPESSSVTVAGDAWAYDALARTARLTQSPVVWYATDTTARNLADRLDPAHRMTITDTNRRQAAIPNRLTAGFGPLLPETSPQPSPSRVLGATGDQSVLHRTGPTLTANQVGSAFFDLPYGQPDNVLDGDDSTAWLFGDFRRASGAQLEVGFPAAQRLDTISIRPAALGKVHIDSVTLTAGGVSKTVRLPDTGTAQVDLGGVTSDKLTLRVDGIRGDGFSLVGIAELGLPGAKVERVLRTPTTFDRLFDELDPVDQARFGSTPLDVSFSRAANTPSLNDDSEKQLLRDFTLPTARSFTSAAQVRMVDRSEAAFDRLSGGTQTAIARSSGTYFDNPDIRASMASDGDEGTAWWPGGDLIGAWWEIEGPTRPVDSVVVQQRPTTGAVPARTATRVDIEIDGKVVTTAATRAGRTEIKLPAGTTGATVRMVIRAVEGPADGLPPQFTSIEAQARTDSGTEGICVTVAKMDGQPLRMRPVDLGAVARSGGAATSWVGCSPTVLGSGEHALRPVPGFVIDGMDLTDSTRTGADKGSRVDHVATVTGSDVDQVIGVSASDEPVALKIGQSWDPRWRASIDGVDLGPPVRVDGWSTGWVVPAGKARSVHVQFGPERATSLALVLSGLVVLGASGLVLFGIRRQRRRTPKRSVARDRTAAPQSDSVQTRHWLVNTMGHRALWWVRAGALTAVVGLAFGVAGLFGLALAYGLVRIPGTRPFHRILIGAGLVVLGGVVQTLATREAWGTVNVTVPSASMWPHWLAVVGIVVALTSTISFVRSQNPREGLTDERG